MVEAVNRHVKYYYLFKNELKDLDDTTSYLSNSVLDYSNKSHGKLFGLTPIEVLGGIIPDEARFRQDMIKARLHRLEVKLSYDNLNPNATEILLLAVVQYLLVFIDNLKLQFGENLIQIDDPELFNQLWKIKNLSNQ